MKKAVHPLSHIHAYGFVEERNGPKKMTEYLSKMPGDYLKKNVQRDLKHGLDVRLPQNVDGQQYGRDDVQD